MKLEEDFLTAEMDYNTSVMKNEVPASWKFFSFFIITLSTQGQNTMCCFDVSVLPVFSFVGFGV